MTRSISPANPSDPEDLEGTEQGFIFEADKEEDSIEDDEEGETPYQNPDMPIEIVGVRVVTAALAHNMLANYNAEAVAWIEQNTEQITSSGRQAAEAAYPWIVKTLASYPSPFRSSLDGHLEMDHCNSFPRSLLSRSGDSGSKFKDLHAIVFSRNSKIASAYVEAAQQGSPHITTEQIAESLLPLSSKPGLYGFSFRIDGKYYIGRSLNVKRRVGQHINSITKGTGVNRFVRSATTSPDDWSKGAIIVFDDKVPTAILAAIETSLIACHGSTLPPQVSCLSRARSHAGADRVACRQSQHNIVDGLCLPRPLIPDEELAVIYSKYKRGESMESIGVAHNLDDYSLDHLLARQPSLKRLLNGNQDRTSEYMAIQKLRISDPIDPPTVNRTYALPHYPQFPALHVDLSPGDGTGPLATRSINESWNLLDFALERPLREAMDHTLDFPVAAFRRQFEEDYELVFAGYRIGH